jgi:hypothetical protein
MSNRTHGAPQHTIECIDNYVKHRLHPGGFVTAVLCNDLREAIARADHVNIKHLVEIVAYCWNEIPHTCWGSEEKVVNWLSQKGTNGED